MYLEPYLEPPDTATLELDDELTELDDGCSVDELVAVEDVELGDMVVVDAVDDEVPGIVAALT